MLGLNDELVKRTRINIAVELGTSLCIFTCKVRCEHPVPAGNPSQVDVIER